MTSRDLLYADPISLEIEGTTSTVDDLTVGGALTVGGQITAGTGENVLTNAAGLIDGAKIQSGTVAGTQLESGTIQTGNIATGSITADKIATDAVGSDEIVEGAVGTSEVTNNSLTSNDLATNSVTSDEIVAGAVGTSEVADNSLTANDLAIDSVGMAEIADGAVTSSSVADNSLTSNDLATNSVTDDEIATGAVRSAEVLNNSLTADDLAYDSVGTSELADDAVTPEKLVSTSTYEMGKLGLGAAPPADALFSLKGPETSQSGPHIRTISSGDNYPIFGITSWQHDNIGLRFDTWWDGTHQRSSDAGSNALVCKYQDSLWFRYSSGNAVDSAFSFTTSAMLINLTTGSILMPQVYLMTVGGTNRDLYIDDTGKLGYIASSIEYKENVRDAAEQDTAWIYTLLPVMFDYKDKAQGVNQCGLIAEEVASVHPEIVSYKREITYGPEATDEKGNPDPSGYRPMIVTTTTQPETVNYSRLTVPMLAEMKKLRSRVDELETQLAKYQELEARLAALEGKK